MGFRVAAVAGGLEPVAPTGSRRKVHLPMDTATSDIRAVEFTPSRDGDSPVLPDLLDRIPEDEDIGTVTAEGAYDTRRCHTPSSTGKPRRSFRSAGMDVSGTKTARPHAPETTACAPPSPMVERPRRAGQATRPEAGSRRDCAA